jgi:hypothetical protein
MNNSHFILDSLIGLKIRINTVVTKNMVRDQSVEGFQLLVNFYEYFSQCHVWWQYFITTFESPKIEMESRPFSQAKNRP